MIESIENTTSKQSKVLSGSHSGSNTSLNSLDKMENQPTQQKIELPKNVIKFTDGNHTNRPLIFQCNFRYHCRIRATKLVINRKVATLILIIQMDPKNWKLMVKLL